MSEKIYTQEMFCKKSQAKKKSTDDMRPQITYLSDAIRRLKSNKAALLSLVLLTVIFILAVFVPVFGTTDYRQQNPALINQAPSAQNWFGTDSLGRDLFVRCWMGARISLLIAFIATFINVTIGIVYGGVSGYFGKKTDLLMMRIIEIIYSVPDLLWVMLLMVIMGPGLKTIITAISITGWGSMARLVRGQVLQLKQMEYVQAAKLLGADFRRIIFKHLIPNAMGPIIIDLTFSIPNAIFAEALLSYLGLGIPVPLASWGTLANEGARMLLLKPYQLFFPALLLSLTMLSFNLLGDGLRDALDPKLRR